MIHNRSAPRQARRSQTNTRGFMYIEAVAALLLAAAATTMAGALLSSAVKQSQRVLDEQTAVMELANLAEKIRLLPERPTQEKLEQSVTLGETTLARLRGAALHILPLTSKNGMTRITLELSWPDKGRQQGLITRRLTTFAVWNEEKPPSNPDEADAELEAGAKP